MVEDFMEAARAAGDASEKRQPEYRIAAGMTAQTPVAI